MLVYALTANNSLGGMQNEQQGFSPEFDKLVSMLVLGIESSCDETAAAVVRDGTEILSSVIASQIEMHKPWGGVVPELASREHLEKIEPIVNESLSQANLKLSEIDAIAVTQGPGLIGSLLVGVCYADRKSTRLNSSHPRLSRMPSSA